jgi:hypothetical protein
MPGLPQTCDDDYECNGGKANYPLRCMDVVVAKVCVDPDDLTPASAEPAYEPLVVRPDPKDPRQSGRR